MNDISQSIQYAKYSFNPVTGCLARCPYCYGRAIATRFMPKETPPGEWRDGAFYAEPGHPFPVGFKPTFYPWRLEEPAKKRTPALVFVGDMADLWAGAFAEAIQQRILDSLQAAPQHRYLLLTQQPQNYPELPAVCWPGATIRSGADRWRADALRKVDAAVRWVSAEPLQGTLGSVDLEGISWVTLGPETGRRRHTTEQRLQVQRYAEYLVKRCMVEGIPVYMKAAMQPYWEGPLIREWPTAAAGLEPVRSEQTRSEQTTEVRTHA